MFKFLLGLVALSVAACAAFFSVQGVASLYSDQFLAVCIMATSLEFGKLVAATYLHRYWSSAANLLKAYLTTAVVILMAITSLGIFGFLTSAYQKNFSQVELVDSKQEIFLSRKEFIEKEILALETRISTLNEARSSQEKRLPSLSRLAAKPIYDDIERAGKEIQMSREKINELSKQLESSTNEVIDLKIKKNEHHDIGTLQFVASTIHVKTEHVVNWFTLIIVLVFDPLALCLILAYSSLTSKKENLSTESLPSAPPINPGQSVSKDTNANEEKIKTEITELKVSTITPSSNFITSTPIPDNSPLHIPEEGKKHYAVIQTGSNLDTPTIPAPLQKTTTVENIYAYEDHINETAYAQHDKLASNIQTNSKQISGKYRA